MSKIARYRAGLFAVALALNFGVVSTAASAELEMVVGPRLVVQNTPVSACSAKAKGALEAVLLNAFEAGAGTGQWEAGRPVDSSGQSTAAAAIHCFPIGNGYVVTFACATDIPPDSDHASDLCDKLLSAFNAEKTAALTAPLPSPGGAR